MKITQLVQDSAITLLHILEIALPATIALGAQPIHSFKIGEVISHEGYVKEIYQESKQEFLKKMKRLNKNLTTLEFLFT